MSAFAHAPQLSSSQTREQGRQIASFAGVGIASTLIYTVLFAGLDSLMQHQLANALSLTLCTIGNTYANQRLTFHAGGHARTKQAHARSLTILAFTLFVTAGALEIEHHLWPQAGTAVDTATTTLANVVATCVRYGVLRRTFRS